MFHLWSSDIQSDVVWLPFFLNSDESHVKNDRGNLPIDFISSHAPFNFAYSPKTIITVEQFDEEQSNRIKAKNQILEEVNECLMAKNQILEEENKSLKVEIATLKAQLVQKNGIESHNFIS